MTFPLTGEPLALDLLNTEAATGDLVADPAALTAWLAAQAGRLTPVDSVGEAEVAAVRAVREAARPALDAVRRGERPPAAALRALNEALAAAPSHRVLAWAEEGGITAAAHRPADPARRLAAELAEAVAELLTDPGRGRCASARRTTASCSSCRRTPTPLVCGVGLRQPRPGGPLLRPPQGRYGLRPCAGQPAGRCWAGTAGFVGDS